MTDPCNGCGRCVRRCPFGAISQQKMKKEMLPATPFIQATICRGCGVCATGCPQEAIRMEKNREFELKQNCRLALRNIETVTLFKLTPK